MSVACLTITSFAFPSELGWFGLAFETAGRGPRLARLVFGHRSQSSALTRLAKVNPAAVQTHEPLPQAVEEWIGRLQCYAQGQPCFLADIPLADDHLTPFGRRVAKACRAIPWGATRTYGQLAVLAGRPRAARAVGSVMAKNRTPLVAPCHRVLGANGRLGGFSAPQGVAMKKRLLELEKGRSD